MAVTVTDDAPARLAEGLLRRIGERLRRPVPEPYADVLRAVPRHLFLPERVWVRDGSGGYRSVDRRVDAEGWLAAAYDDAPLVTQFRTTDDGARIPSSSASMPSMVVRALELAALDDGMRVLEIGTGTGFNTALLCARLGADRVTTVEIDPGLYAEAGRNLAAAGFAPRRVLGDGAEGEPGGGPYERVLATCSVRAVPPAWPAQTAPYGRIVTPWDSPWCCYGTLTLTRRPDGTASGPFTAFGSYMVLRGQHTDAALDRGLPRAGEVPEETRTALSPWAVAGGDLDAEFHLGVTVPGAWFSWDSAPAADAVHTRLWVADTESTSWASVDYDGRDAASFRVRQHGPRRLWHEIEAAYGAWDRLDRPTIGHHTLTMTPSGASTITTDRPAELVRRGDLGP
ncbi:methyltransferase domain-containing protein [Streptomyces varsoviensis]|uniref:methyltransferase domain-containing protein n=1 Tax=Streptomyces varsoviensis TaxID=67373 RepID=UPI000A5BF80B|nr:methyltransferase domain-containing protein [Streptomyces varsoviensis]